jgi:hypothetical protein
VDLLESISSLIEKLSWETPEDEKEEAKKKLQYIRDEDLHLLLQPISKEYWDGAAETVVRLGYPLVKCILPGLLEWIHCEALHKEFFNQQPNVMKQFHEHNKDRFYICNAISNLKNNISEIEIFTAECLT